MGALAITLASTDAPPFFRPIGRAPSGGEAYSTIISSAGNTTGVPSVSLLVTGGLYTFNKWIDVAIDLREYALVDFATANITSTPLNSGAINMWSTSSYNSVGIINQRESVRGVNYDTDVDYRETYQSMAAGTDLFTDFPHSSLIVAGVAHQFNFTAAGLSYLNSVATKAYNPGYAYMSMVAGGQAANATPDLGTSTGGYHSFWATSPVFNATFTSPIKVNVGDVWRDVIGVQINQTGSAWRYGTDIKVNVGDAWKDIR